MWRVYTLSATQLSGVAEVLENRQGSLTVIALDFDSPFVDRAARSAGGFQLRQDGVQIRCDRVEPRDDGHGLALAPFLTANAGGLVRRQQDCAGFAACADAQRQGLFAYLAGDGALQRCSIKQARHRKDDTRFAPYSEPKTRWTELAGGLTRILPRNAATCGRNRNSFGDNIFAENERLSGTIYLDAVDRIDCSR